MSFVAAYLFDVFVLQVVGAKVVTSARSPGTHCFGFVTMSSSEEAAKCIEQLNKAEVHGKVITVEWVSFLIRSLSRYFSTFLYESFSPTVPFTQVGRMLQLISLRLFRRKMIQHQRNQPQSQVCSFSFLLNSRKYLKTLFSHLCF